MWRFAWSSCRFYSSSSYSVASSPLALLRKRTGYQISKCKEALVRSNNDLGLAEEWLKEQAKREGWMKSDQSRDTKQGVIGAYVDGKAATMLEVNCETDFVANNQTFLQYVSEAVKAAADHLKLHPPQDPRWHLKSHDLISLRASGGGTLGDLTAEKMGLFGEKINLTRGYHMRLEEGGDFISSYTYNGTYLSDVGMGKYGCLVHLIDKPQPPTSHNFTEKFITQSKDGETESEEIKEEVTVPPHAPASVGSQLAQHIIGCNPRVIGGGGEDDLLEQRFLFGEGVAVGAWLRAHGLSVGSFVRFGVGDESQ